MGTIFDVAPSALVMVRQDEPGMAILRRIADALGIPVERFFDDAAPPEAIDGAGECLRLWFAIRTMEGRQQALASLRAIVEAEA